MGYTVRFPIARGFSRLDIRDPDSNIVSSIRSRAGYSWQGNSAGSGTICPDRLALEIDKFSGKAGDTINLSSAAPAAGKGDAMAVSHAPLWWEEIAVLTEGMDLTFPYIGRQWRVC